MPAKRLLLDSTVLIDLLRLREDRSGLMRSLVESGYELTTSAVNVGEVYSGLRVGEEKRTAALFGQVEICVVTAAIAERAGSLVRDQKRRGRTVQLADMIVAATALEHGLTLVTDNVKDFQIGELKLLPLP